RIAVRAATRSRQRQLVNRVFGALQVTRQPGVGFVRRLVPGSWVPGRLISCQAPVFEWPCVLNAAELTGLIAWPFNGPVIDGVTYTAGRPLPASHRSLVPPEVVRALDSTRVGDQLRVIGEATYPGRDGLLVLRPADAMQHLHVLAPTGSGKSHLLANLALQDIAAGRAIVVIEPKGDLVADILDRVPAQRQSDIVVLDASDLTAPVGLNPLATARGSQRELVVDQLLGTMHNLWRDSWGPRTNDVLHAGLLTLAGQPGASLIGLPQLFVDDVYRRSVVGEAVKRDPWGLASFWAWFDSLSVENRTQVLAPVMNKLRSFILRPALRAILGQPEPRFDLSQVFTQRKTLLVNLAKGSLGAETAGLLGSLLVAQLWQHTQARSRIDPERRHPVMVFIDEFQDYLNLPSDMADVLAQARGLGVGMTLSHQHLGQLSTEVRDAVLANARSRVVFRLPHRDARVVAEGHRELTPEDIAGLDRYAVYVSLLTDGTVQPFASGRTRALPESSGAAGAIRAASRQRWGVPATETDAHLAALFGPVQTVEFGEDEFGSRRRMP
ncbi:MAG: type IV secretory system conjugative DNA transfer family protein, partial [Microthrixaceae bacterium]